MNVSNKVLVIIYVIFALLISVTIFASQGILYSSFSHLEDREANGSAKEVQNLIDFQILQLDEANAALSSRDDVRAFMLNPEQDYLGKTTFADFFSLNRYDFIFLADSRGNVLYSKFSSPGNNSRTEISSEIKRRFADRSLLCKDPESPVKGLILIGNSPAVISCRPILASQGSKEVIGTIALGKNLDENFRDSVQKITGNSILPYSLNSVPAAAQQGFLESKSESLVPGLRNNREGNYFVLEDINKNPAFTVWTNIDTNISTERQTSIRYIVLFLLCAGLFIGVICKILFDREVVSRIVAINTYVEKVGTREDFSARYYMEGNDELSRLTEGINRMLDRMQLSSEKVKAQEHEKKIILNSLSEFVVFVDPDLRIVWANKAFLDYMGSKLEELVGHEYENMLLMHDADCCKSFLRKALESGTEQLREVATPDGRTWMICATVIRADDGRITGVLQTGLDITPHKLSEERLLQAKLEAEAANRTKSEFLANMSHELRTPLNSIIGFSDILLERIFGELNEKQLRYVKNISSSGKHLLELINEILDLSKIEAGKMELHYSEFSINSVFEEVKGIIIPLARKKSLDVTFSVESFTALEADRGRLVQVLYNLVSNAVKFTPDGGKIFVHCRKSGNQVLVSVKDTGIGISAEDQEKIFQPFTQIDGSTSRQFCGTGLGLALVKKIANLHQGEIRVESDPEKGSTFILAMPLKKPAGLSKDNGAAFEDLVLEFEMNKIEALSVKECSEDPSGEVELPEICLPEKTDLKQGLVLVVDDDKNSNELLSVVLREAGFSIASLYRGKDLVPVSKELKPDLITLEVMLPDTNGWTILKQLKNDPLTASIPVLIISVTNINELGSAFGATYSVEKPVRRAELVDSLKKITGKLKSGSPGVLIIDDDDNSLELLSSMIEQEGFKVSRAYGGKDGLKKLFSEQPPDILVLDLLMPEVSGFDIISSMRADARTKDIPIIVCSSGDFLGKNIDELNIELKKYLVSIMKKGTFGRKELINRIKQLAMLKRSCDE